MRIAYLINQYPAVSHSFIRREIRALERIGFDVMRISLRGWDRELADAADREERARTHYVLSDGAMILGLQMLRMLVARPVRFIRSLAMAWRLSRRSERPLYAHLAYLAEACRIEPWLREQGIEHLHAHFGTNPAEVAMLVHTLGGPAWSFTAHGTETFDNPQLVGLAEKALRCAFAVAVSSYGRAQIYRSLAPQHWPKIHIVHCGLDPAFWQSPAASPSATQRIVCVGRLSAEKGHRMLLDAAAHLKKAGTDFELVLAGDGELRPVIEAEIARLGLAREVRITGWISGAQVREQLLAARALVLASFSEGLPVVLMEAMALRRPVIATFIGGIPELVRPGQDGWLVPAGDAVALSQAMQECLAAPPEVIARMGEAARERVMLRHDVNKEALKLGNLFRSAAGAAAGTGQGANAPRKTEAAAAGAAVTLE